jgi:hypothetical protein
LSGLKSKVVAMPDAVILSFADCAKRHRLNSELTEWRIRLRLAFERNWDWRARELCKKEIRRLSDLAEAQRRNSL